MRRLARATAAVLCTGGLLAGIALGGPAVAAPQPVTADDCKRVPGVAAPTSTWALDRFQLARVDPITRGKFVDTGQPVPVAVIDSGLDRTHPQLRSLTVAPQQDAIRDDPGKAFVDCVGHGTQVTAVLAAQPDRAHPQFAGVSPQVKIIPIKVTNTADGVQDTAVARGIDLAVQAGAKIANMSLVLPVDVPVVRAAVARAQRAGMLIVAAAGNDGNAANRYVQYPAAYAPTFDNVLGVGATTQTDGIADFSGQGRYLGVVAPGDGVQSIGVSGGYLVVKGTSFAAPYVSGVAALVLAAHPGMSAKALRDRLLATADSPPATVPDSRWGYGSVDPYLAVTSVRADAPATAPTSPRPQPVVAGTLPAAADRSQQHRALAIALGLLGLMITVMVAAAVARGQRRAPAPAR